MLLTSYSLSLLQIKITLFLSISQKLVYLGKLPNNIRLTKIIILKIGEHVLNIVFFKTKE